VEYVKSGMVVGLGTGSTAAFAVDRIGQLLKEGGLTDIVGVPTSVRTYEQAKSERPGVQHMRAGGRSGQGLGGSRQRDHTSAGAGRAVPLPPSTLPALCHDPFHPHSPSAVFTRHAN
jgi:hypothetical protein